MRSRTTFNAMLAALLAIRTAAALRIGFMKPGKEPLWRNRDLEIDKSRICGTKGAFGKNLDGLSRRWSRQAKRFTA